MKLKWAILKCVGCKAKEKRTELPSGQPFCANCGAPMILDSMKAAK